MKAQCECCGKLVDENKMEWNDEGSGYCKQCTKEMIGACSICNNNFPFWQMSATSEGIMFCEHCATAIN